VFQKLKGNLLASRRFRHLQVLHMLGYLPDRGAENITYSISLSTIHDILCAAACQRL